MTSGFQKPFWIMPAIWKTIVQNWTTNPTMSQPHFHQADILFKCPQEMDSKSLWHLLHQTPNPTIFQTSHPVRPTYSISSGNGPQISLYSHLWVPWSKLKSIYFSAHIVLIQNDKLLLYQGCYINLTINVCHSQQKCGRATSSKIYGTLWCSQHIEDSA